MALPTLTISGKVLGKSQNLFTTWQMDLPEQAGTLAELLTQIVTTEVRAFQTRQADKRLTKVLGLVDIEAWVDVEYSSVSCLVANRPRLKSGLVIQSPPTRTNIFNSVRVGGLCIPSGDFNR